MINLNDIKPWSTIGNSIASTVKYTYRSDLNDKVSLIQADIVNIKIDAIVNAAKDTLLGGGGIDGIIHKSAGSELKNKCANLPIIKAPNTRCLTGQCKVTDTVKCKLNCDYVFHTVGPDMRNKIPLPSIINF